MSTKPRVKSAIEGEKPNFSNVMYINEISSNPLEIFTQSFGKER